MPAPESMEASSRELERILAGRFSHAVGEAAKGMSDDAIPVETVAKVVACALTVASPKTKYLVGSDAKTMARLSWLLPDRILDWLLLKRLGLDKVETK